MLTKLTNFMSSLFALFMVAMAFIVIAAMGVAVMFVGYFLLWGIIGLLILWFIWFLIWAAINEWRDQN